MKKAVKRSFSTFVGTALCVVVAYLLGGCATVTPDFLAPGFTAAEVDSLCVLPVVDHRIDQTKQMKNLDDWVIPLVKRRLKKKGYSYTIEKDRSLVEKVSRDSLETSTPEWIADLGPAGSMYVLMLVLEDSAKKLAGGSTGKAEMTGYLFDKSNRQVVWRKKDMERISGGGGLVGLVALITIEHDAIVKATKKVMSAFPNRR
jgi:hypothetical protein